ncbi:hypothetical protein CBFG_03599 [Clostridiales bacterium 1_7_47FAA]|nr:hypothetical protein CBFG_03599 [Clostridiales bacterium 1_7_47FAA]
MADDLNEPSAITTVFYINKWYNILKKKYNYYKRGIYYGEYRY